MRRTFHKAACIIVPVLTRGAVAPNVGAMASIIGAIGNHKTLGILACHSTNIRSNTLRRWRG